jgi:hypothetical protein
MATASPGTSDPLTKLSYYLSHAQHSVWDRFGAEEQRRMVEYDLTAGKSVSLVLASLITAGLVLSIVSLLVIWAAM